MAIIRVEAEVPGTVWAIEAKPGTAVEEDDPILILESMKMEIPVASPVAGTIRELLVDIGDAVNEGDEIAVLET